MGINIQLVRAYNCQQQVCDLDTVQNHSTHTVFA